MSALGEEEAAGMAAEWSTDAIVACIADTLRQARESGNAISVAVVDSGGHLVGFLRDPDARLVTVTTATGKARCAVMFGRDSAETAEKARESAAFYGFAAASELPFVISDGGYLVESGGCRLGVGVAGASGGLDATLGRDAKMRLLSCLENATAGDQS